MEQENQISSEKLDAVIMEVYKSTVDLCKKENIIDYESKKPLISYLNRDLFCSFIKEEVKNIIDVKN